MKLRGKNLKRNKMFQYETINWFTLKQNAISNPLTISYKFENLYLMNWARSLEL